MTRPARRPFFRILQHTCKPQKLTGDFFAPERKRLPRAPEGAAPLPFRLMMEGSQSSSSWGVWADRDATSTARTVRRFQRAANVRYHLFFESERSGLCENGHSLCFRGFAHVRTIMRTEAFEAVDV